VPVIPTGGAERTVYVCICNGVTERDIREAADAGCRSVAALTMRTGCGANCGSCIDMAAEVLEQARAVPLPLPLLSQAA
jgi:bacterioferritin-associated ferredoxin